VIVLLGTSSVSLLFLTVNLLLFVVVLPRISSVLTVLTHVVLGVFVVVILVVVLLLLAIVVIILIYSILLLAAVIDKLLVFHQLLRVLNRVGRGQFITTSAAV